MKHRHEYTVRGSWPFPTDMLRYDESGAATPADRAVIDRLSTDDPTLDVLRVRVDVRLVHFSSSILWPGPAAERWRSFLWRVKAGGDRGW